jgi:hypothetical protein
MRASTVKKKASLDAMTNLREKRHGDQIAALLAARVA